MQFLILVLIGALVLFLFRLYHLAYDDYVLVKKNVALDEIFNTAFIISLLALFFSRLFYILINPQPIFLHPLGFLLFPYFPGLSLTGGIIGGAISLFLISRKKKFPEARVFDFFSISFIFALPFGFFGYLLLSQEFTTGNIVRLVLYILILAASNIYLYPKANSLEIKDGSSSALILSFFSLISLLGKAIDNPGIEFFISHKENYALIAVLAISIIIILKQEIIKRIPIKNDR